MAKIHLQNVQISNYRGFSKLEIDNLSLVNVIGGTNGIGKSSLLEAIFHLNDRGNPVTLFRPFQWRQIPLQPSDNTVAIQQVYHKKDTSKPILISGNTADGRVSVEYTYGEQSFPTAITQSVQQDDITKGTSETAYTATGEGYRVLAKLGTVTNFDARLRFSALGADMHIEKNTLGAIPASAILTSTIRGSDNGIPIRWSNLVRKGQQQHLYDFLKLVHPEVQDVQILTFGGQAILHADIGGSTWIALPFLGEGASSLISTVLALADCGGAMVLLDEVDATVHHSKLVSMWSLVIRAAKTFDTQVFATTHSDESLSALSLAMQREKAEGDLTYNRLRYSKDNSIKSIGYKGTELAAALSQQWEVR